MNVVFVDTETTGLDPERHEVWEIGLIAPDETLDVRIKPKRLDLADPNALRMTRYYERIQAIGGADFFTDRTRNQVAWDVVRLTAGRHLVGAVPSFDAAFLERFVRAEGYTPAWHYHLIDVETLIVGHLAGALSGADRSQPLAQSIEDRLRLPWDSEALSRAIGVNPSEFERHVAMGDARWAEALYRTVFE